MPAGEPGMVNGKPTMIFGGGQTPAVESKKTTRRSFGMQNTAKPASFASYLQRETQAVNDQLGLPAQAEVKPKAPFLPEGTQPLAADARPKVRQVAPEAADLSKPASGKKRARRLTTPVTGKGGFGMSDTRTKGRSTLASGRTGYGAPADAVQAQRMAAAGAPAGQPGPYGAGAYGTMGMAGGVNSPAAARALENDPTPIRTARAIRQEEQRRRRAENRENASLAVRVSQHRKSQPFAYSLQNALQAGPSTQELLRIFREVQRPENAPAFAPGKTSAPLFARSSALLPGEPGSLSARYESGSDGIAAIGYDRHGGTSYGKFQISSKAGTMQSFIAYLRTHAPEMASRLAAAGPANTGSRNGAMPRVWKQIAAEAPERFERLQNDFIRNSHFEPALASVTESTGLTVAAMPPVLQEVFFSTAVQHGPSGAAQIIRRAVSHVGAGRLQKALEGGFENFVSTGEALIKQIYALRSTQFGSSTQQVQAAARTRLRQEMRDALHMLRA